MNIKERKDKEHLIDYIESLKERIHPVEWNEVKANTIIEELSKSLGTYVGELLTGEYRENENLSGNMKKEQKHF